MAQKYASVVDYMAANKQDSSFGNRSKIAKQYGIHGYQGTAQQNMTLLQKLQSQHSAAKKVNNQPINAVHPVVNNKPMQPKTPQMTARDKRYYDQYGAKIFNGTNDVNGMAHYNHILNQYKVDPAKTHSTYLRQLSQKALGGDKAAAAYLKAMNYKPLTKDTNLWYNFDTKKLQDNNALAGAYRKDNPLSDYSKQYDMRHYDQYNNLIETNAPMTDQQRQWYADTIKKWNLNDYNNPFVQQDQQLNKNEKSQLNAQDSALNNSMATMDANNFQQMQALQQDMSNRGMGNSGIAQDAYTRMTMGANRDYQDAFVQAQQNKANIQDNFFKQHQGVKQNMIDQTNKENDQALKDKELDMQNNQAAAKAQIDRDKYMTDKTGVLYLNNKPLTYKGKAITTLDYAKMTETQRHNIATENNVANGNALDYQLGMAKNATTAAGDQMDYNLGLTKDQTANRKIAADLQKSIAKNKLDYAKLDFDYKKLESTNKYNQAKIKQAAGNAQNSKDKTQITALGKQADQLSKRIAAAQKAGKKPDKKDVDKYNKINGQIDKLIGQSDFFNDEGGSVAYSKASSGSPSAFGGFRYYGKQPKSFTSHMSQAIHKGVPFKDVKLLTELIGRESSFNSNADNPISTAWGYGQFLNDTRKQYKGLYPHLNYNNPVDQIVLTYKYAIRTYGSIQKALQKWESRSPHWY